MIDPHELALAVYDHTDDPDTLDAVAAALAARAEELRRPALRAVS